MLVIFIGLILIKVIEMSEYKIYAVKAKNLNGSSFNGRFKATNMQDATKQALDYLNEWGVNWNVSINELKNQKLAMRKWEEFNS